MMGFIFGLVVGYSLTSGQAPEARQMLSQIPLRCLYLVDDEGQYVRCRFPSMRHEFYDRSVIECDGFSGFSAVASCKDKFTIENIKWELGALKQMADAAAKQKNNSQ